MSMKIYTKTGDEGKTSLIGGTKVIKSNPRIEAYGTVDELNSYIGLLSDFSNDEHTKDILKEIQDRLFTIGSELACDPGKETKVSIPDLHESDVEVLEKEMDKMDAGVACHEAFYFARRPTFSIIYSYRTLRLQACRKMLCRSQRKRRKSRCVGPKIPEQTK